MFAPGRLRAQKAEPLPVFLWLDVSGSTGEVVNIRNVRRTGQTTVSDRWIWESVEGEPRRFRF